MYNASMGSEQNKPPHGFIGDDREQWLEYREEHGPEAYKYRRLYEVTAGQLLRLHEYAEQQGIELPTPGPGAD